MKSALKPALDNVEEALESLEMALQDLLTKSQKKRQEPQLELARDERAINKKIAAKLDQTISRLETLLTEEE
jgi:hypothetical protein